MAVQIGEAFEKDPERPKALFVGDEVAGTGSLLPEEGSDTNPDPLESMTFEQACAWIRFQDQYPDVFIRIWEITKLGGEVAERDFTAINECATILCNA